MTATTAAPASRKDATLVGLASVFGLITLTSFGGGQKASIRRQLVHEKGWITDDEFIEGLEAAELLPGPNVLNLAVFMGERVLGVPGAVVSFFAATVPPFAIILCVAMIYSIVLHSPWVRAALLGAAAGAVGITLANAFELTFEGKVKVANLLFIAATAVAVTYFHVSLLLTLAIFGSLSMLTYYMTHMRKRNEQH